MVVAPLHFEVWAVFSVSPSSMMVGPPGGILVEASLPPLGELFVSVDTLPPERMRRRFAPTIPEKPFLGGGTMVELMVG